MTEKKISIWHIIAVASVLIFFRISHVDVTGDDAIYTVRSVGMADFMFGDANFQPTPVFWYASVPGWTHLSFHDHPELLFLIQHIFLSINDSIFFSKLPYALFVLGTIGLTYFTLKKFFSRAAGLSAALLLALNAHVIWAGRVAFMEGGVMFFVALALHYLLAFLKDKKNWWKLGIALGLALSAKFTTVFLVPSIITAVLVTRRELFKKKELYGMFILTLFMQLPSIAYNWFLYRDRGHFSLQIARLLQQKTSPWPFPGVENSGFLTGLRTIFFSLGGLISWPYLLLALTALVYIAMKRREAIVYVLGFLFLTVQQMFIGQSGYGLAIYGVFLSPLIALAYESFRLKQSEAAARKLSWLAYAFIVFIGFFTVNSHAFARHFGSIGWTRSEAISENFGVEQLDVYLQKILTSRPWGEYDVYWSVKQHDPWLKKYETKLSQAELDEEIKSSSIILYDGDISWPARLWLFERRLFYNNLPLISTNKQEVLNQLRLKSFYLIKATEAAPLDPASYRTHKADTLESMCEKLGVKPELIYRDDGKVAFKVYWVSEEVFAKASSL